MAHIISFPNSAAAPVQQRRGPGRHPKMVVCLRQWRFQAGAAARAAQSLQAELASQRELLSTLEGVRNDIRHKVAVLQQQCSQAPARDARGNH